MSGNLFIIKINKRWIEDVAFEGESNIEEGDGDNKESGPKEVETNKD